MNTDKEKKSLIEKHSPRSPTPKNCVLAFLIGGAVCSFGEVLLYLFNYLGMDKETSLTMVTVTLIVLASVATALGFFDKIARFAGAGTLVPVTGFSNAMTSQAVDSRSEGFILGVGAKIFTIAGPVIVYGILSGVLYGLVYFLIGFFIK